MKKMSYWLSGFLLGAGFLTGVLCAQSDFPEIPDFPGGGNADFPSSPPADMPPSIPPGQNIPAPASFEDNSMMSPPAEMSSEMPQEEGVMVQNESSSPEEFSPHWRPRPNPRLFPQNPFSGIAVATSTMAFQEEFNALSESILGVLEVGGSSVLVIKNDLIREGEKIILTANQEDEKRGRRKKGSKPDTKVSTARAPEAIFVGIDHEKKTAKFRIADMEIPVELPTTKRKLRRLKGKVERIGEVGTATFLSAEGLFVASMDVFPESDDQASSQQVFLKTAFGTHPASIIKKDKESHLVLGQATLRSSELGQEIAGIQWGGAKGWQSSMGVVYAYDSQSGQTFSRPQTWRLSAQSKNPNWLVGAPMFLNGRMVGVVAKQGEQFVPLGKDELRNIFPQLNSAFSQSQKPAEETQGFFDDQETLIHPEKLVALIYISG